MGHAAGAGRYGLSFRAKSTKYARLPGLAIESGFADLVTLWPSSNFLIGSSIFFPDSVRGTAAIWKISLGTWRADKLVRTLSRIFDFSASSNG